MKKQTIIKVQEQLKQTLDIELLETIQPLLHTKEVKDTVSKVINDLKNKA